VATIECRPGDLGRLMREHGAERERRVLAAQQESAERAAAVIRERLPRDTGGLRESTHAARGPDGPEVRIDAPYAGSIEAGARPHWVPLEDLIPWAQRHAGALGLPDATAVERYAAAVQRKIARDGMPPHWVVRGALPDLQRILDERTRSALDQSPTTR